MTLPRSIFVGAALLLLLPGFSGGQEKSEQSTSAESLRHWQYFHTVTAKGDDKGKYRDFFLPPAVFGPARTDLVDLRLYDVGGKEIPYALRVLKPDTQREPISAKVYNRTTNSDGSASLRLDLGKDGGEHNQIQIDLSGVNYRRPFKLEGSDTDGNWSTILDKKFVTHYKYGDQTIRIDRFEYPDSRFRYLRLTVSLDPSKEKKKREKDAKLIRKVQIFRFVDLPGKSQTHDAALDVRQAVPTGLGPGSAWYITFGGHKPPIEKLLFHTSSAHFVRPYRLEGITGGGSSQTIARGEWRRGEESDMPLVIQVPERSFRKFRLVVTDQRNEPLQLNRAKYTMWARQVIFESSGEMKLPLRLYYGNPEAKPPGYDFAARLPKKLASTPVSMSVGPQEKNPTYQPKPKPWTERFSWLIYVVLGLVNLVLLGLLIQLGRLAITRHDESQKTENESGTEKESRLEKENSASSEQENPTSS